MEYDQIINDLVEQLAGIAESYQRSGNADVWYESFYYALEQAHTDSWIVGRNIAGDLSGITDADRAEGIFYAQQEQQWLDGFYKDLVEGRYLVDEVLNLQEITRRSMLYVHKTRGTANASFDLNSPTDLWFDWVLGGIEDHCPDCPYFAEFSPYPQGGLPARPGDGSTPCLFNCKCFLRRSDGVEGLKPINLKNFPGLKYGIITMLEDSWYANERFSNCSCTKS